MRIRVSFEIQVDVKMNLEKPLKDISESQRDIIISMAVDKITRNMVKNQVVNLKEIK